MSARRPRQLATSPIFLVAFALASLVLPGGEPGQARAAGPDWREATPVTLDYFYVPGCADCVLMDRDLLPQLALQYADTYTLTRWDLDDETHYLRLVAWQERLTNTVNAHVYMLVDGRYLLNGWPEIRDRLCPLLDERISAHRSEAGGLTGPVVAPAPAAALFRRLRGFTLAGVTAGGLVDSLNPCAISTLVFFISLLSVAGFRGRRLFLPGGAFVLGSFLTYFALGLGLLNVLRALTAFRWLRIGLDAAMVALLAVLAWLSFRDAWRFRRTGNPGDVSLQLSAGGKQRIHAIMRRGLAWRHLLLGGFAVGSAVTALESVCTGQVYVPTLVFILKSGQSGPRALGYLVVYNLMFVLPLLVILALTYRGLQMPRLLDWSRRNVVLSKILLGLFFVVMAALILAL